MNKKKFEKAIDFYRSIARKEIADEKMVNGELIGPRSDRLKMKN
jgi:hypothetical protein